MRSPADVASIAQRRLAVRTRIRDWAEGECAISTEISSTMVTAGRVRKSPMSGSECRPPGCGNAITVERGEMQAVSEGNCTRARVGGRSAGFGQVCASR